MTDSEQRVKLILNYDILSETQERYYQYILGEMTPALQALGLVMSGAWHTAYGNYPVRMVEFVAEDWEQLQTLLGSSAWEQMETRLLKYVTNYTRKVVPLREDRFQF